MARRRRAAGEIGPAGGDATLLLPDQWKGRVGRSCECKHDQVHWSTEIINRHAEISQQCAKGWKAKQAVLPKQQKQRLVLDVFIRTYRRDMNGVLPFTLHTLRQHGRGVVNAVILCIPSADRQFFCDMLEALPEDVRRLVRLVHSHSPYVFSDIARADLVSDAPLIMHFDGDMLLCEGLGPDDFIDEQARDGAIRTISRLAVWRATALRAQ